MNKMFTDTNQINNYENIISVIINDPQFEHIDEIIGIVEEYDQKRDKNSLEFKQVIFTVIRGLLRDPRVKPSYIGSFVKGIEENPPKTEEEIFEYLDTYWNTFGDTGRGYLLFFSTEANSQL